jgi:hypothetical protein
MKTQMMLGLRLLRKDYDSKRHLSCSILVGISGSSELELENLEVG